MTPREQYNETLKVEVDLFAARMKGIIDDFESQLKGHERMERELSSEIDRLHGIAPKVVESDNGTALYR